MKIILRTLLLAALAAGMPLAHAQGDAAKKSAPGNTVAKKAQSREQASSADDEEAEPDTTGSVSTDYQCELGNRLTIYRNEDDDRHIALRWKRRLHRMTRVDTSTGAERFENRRYGLVWIGIPAKGILLDSKQGRQLANECRNAEQAAAAS
jgi:hypothetical protein